VGEGESMKILNMILLATVVNLYRYFFGMDNLITVMIILFVWDYIEK
jgi:hypothetical protein